MDDLETIKSKEYSWPTWPVEGGHLSLRGSMLEYMSGEYFKGFFETAGLNLTPQKTYFCASPKQRTVETSRAFAAGLFPHRKIDIFYRGPRDFSPKYLDPEFLPLLNDQDYPGEFQYDAFQKEARQEMLEIANQSKEEVLQSLDYLAKTIGYANSAKASLLKKNRFDFDIIENLSLDFYKNNGKGETEKMEPDLMDCDFKMANRASDALILQYYEQDDKVLTSPSSKMTKDLERNDWERIASVKDVYGDVLFTAPIVAVNVSHAMLGMLRRMICDPVNSLNFICTHDSSMAALLAALRTEEYELSQTIEKRTPIGFKILFEKWKIGKEHYVRVRLAYYSSDQIRTSNPADVQGTPLFVELGFKGLTRDQNGMYRYDDFIHLVDRTLELYELTAMGKNPFAD